MGTAIQTALSGLMAETRRFAVSAYNVANLRSAGVDPAATAAAGRPAGTGGAAPYVPRHASATTDAGGGVRVLALPVTPPSVALYNPSDPAADPQGLVHLPNVSLEQELVTQRIAVRSFQANLAVLKAQDEMTGALLDLKA